MWRRHLAVGLVLLPVGVVVVGLVAPDLAMRAVYEEGPVEWLQVGLCLIAAGQAIAYARHLARAREPVAFEILVAAGLLALALGELELDRWWFGTKVIGKRFLFRPRKPVAWPWRVLTVAIALGVPVALVIYAIARFRQVVRAGLAALAAAWGRVLLAGGVLYALAILFEKHLNRVHFVSHVFVEEVVELLAACCFVAALLLRPRPRP